MRKLLEHIGTTPLTEWCRVNGLPYTQVWALLNRNVKRLDAQLGVDIEKATEGKVTVGYLLKAIKERAS